MTLWTQPPPSDAIIATSVRVVNGPYWTDPAGTKRIDVVGSSFVLIDRGGTALVPDENWVIGRKLRVTGLMQTVSVKDTRGRWTSTDPQGKYLVPGIRVKKIEFLSDVDRKTKGVTPD